MSERNGYQPGVPCWIATWQPEPEEATRFYAELFAWEVEEATPFGRFDRHFICRLRGRDVAAIGSPPRDVGPAWDTYVWVERTDESARKAAEAGAWSWSGLNTRDPKRSKAFYSAVFGWETDTFDAGGAELVTWRVPGYLGGQPEQPVARDVVAGMATMTGDGFPDDARPHWGVDFWVDDVDAAAQSTPKLGGKVVAGPLDTRLGEPRSLPTQGARCSR